MASYCYGGHILMLPEEEETDKYDEASYPFSVPKVILEGFVDEYMPPKDVYSTSMDSIVTVRGNVVTKFIKSEFSEQLVEDEKGNAIWFDSREVPFDGTFPYKFLGEWREAEEYTVEKIDLEKKSKKIYKVTLQETTPLSDWELEHAAEYQKIEKKNIVGDFVLDGSALVKYKGKSAEVVLPDGITSIEYAVFGGCDFIRSITIPNSVTSIGCSAFANCTALQNITIPNSVTSIHNCAFEGCTALQSIKIPNGVTTIGHSVFRDCTALQNVTLPRSVKSIDSVFSGCTALKSITLPSSVEHIGIHAFCDCPALKSVTIPASVMRIGGCLFSGTTCVEEIIVDPENPKYYAKGNCIIEKRTGVLVSGSNRSIISDGVMSIANAAFYDCSGLKNIIIPNGVMSIGMCAFRDCAALKLVIIQGNIKVIEEMAFADCTALASIDIPDSVTKIERCAFCKCSSLTEINFRGTRAQWEAVEKGERWDDGTGEYRVYCSDDDDCMPF